MNLFKNILCYYAPPNGVIVLERAVRLAQENHAQLTVVTVVPQLPDYYPVSVPPASGMTLSGLYQTTLKHSSKVLDQAVKPWRQKGFDMHTQVLTGIPFLEIIQKVLRDHHDLVVTSVGAKDKAARFSSTTLRLIRKCPCPVWVMTSSHTRPYHKIMAAIDPEPGQTGKRSLNHQIVTMASGMAALEKSALTVVHCWGKYPELMLGFDYVDVPPIQITQVLEQTKTLHQKWLDDFTKHLTLPSGQHIQTRLLAGEPGDELPSQARKEKVDLLVMGTVAHTGLAGLLLGHTAEKVLNQLHCSLLALKPKGFHSPVKLSRQR